MGLKAGALDHLLGSLCQKKSIEAPIPNVPKGVLVSERRGDKGVFLTLLNPHTEAASVPLPAGMTELRSGAACEAKRKLGPWDGAVLRRGE